MFQPRSIVLVTGSEATMAIRPTKGITVRIRMVRILTEPTIPHTLVTVMTHSMTWCTLETLTMSLERTLRLQTTVTDQRQLQLSGRRLA